MDVIFLYPARTYFYKHFMIVPTTVVFVSYCLSSFLYGLRLSVLYCVMIFYLQKAVIETTVLIFPQNCGAPLGFFSLVEKYDKAVLRTRD